MMRFKETQTRYFPEPVPAIPESNIQVIIQKIKNVCYYLPNFSIQSHFLVDPDLVGKDGETNLTLEHKFTMHFQTYLLL